MSSNTEWARVTNTTIVKHLREREKANLRNHKIGALMVDRGKIKTRQGGRGFDWRVKYRNHPVTGYTGTEPRNFTPRNLYRVAELEYRGYEVDDAITKKDRLENSGREAIIKVFADMVPDLMESMEEAFYQEFYVDGNAAGNTLRMHGLESFMAPDTTLSGGSSGADTIGISDNTVTSYDAADYVASPSDTYAGLDTDLGTLGGSLLTGDSWPLGTADPEYDYWTPILINYVSTAFGGSTANWAEQGLEAIRFGLTHCMRNSSRTGMIDMVVLDRELYRQSLNKLDAKERVQVTSNKRGLNYFGFDDTFNFDGADVTSDYSCTANEGYGLNIDFMELLSMQESLFDAEGPKWDMNSGSYKTIVDFLGNLKFKSPRNFFKVADFSSNGGY